MEKKNFRNEDITGTIEKSFEKIREKDVSFIFSFPMNTADIPKAFGTHSRANALRGKIFLAGDMALVRVQKGKQDVGQPNA